MGKKTVKIAFLLEIDKRWMGGVNYYLNLLWLIKNRLPNFETYVFISPLLDKDIKEQLQSLSNHLFCVNFLKSKTLSWFLFKICNKLFLRNFIAEKELTKHQIDIVSHTQSLFGNIVSIAWIPDFQHTHLPHMFSKQEIATRNKTFLKLIEKTQATIVSSSDAFKDCLNFAPHYSSKINIFHFISQIDKQITLDQDFLKQHNINPNFFFVPNQLWKHKNHTLLIEAAKILVEKNIDFQIICSGNMNDYRHLDHKQHIFNLIKEYHLEDKVIFLGLVPYKHVIMLMKYSIAVINPSLFEGWSSTVEECKNLGKLMILSDIGVHLEQYPEAFFFQKNDATSLANTIIKTLKSRKNGFVYNYKLNIEQAKNEYQSIIGNILKNKL